MNLQRKLHLKYMSVLLLIVLNLLCVSCMKNKTVQSKPSASVPALSLPEPQSLAASSVTLDKYSALTRQWCSNRLGYVHKANENKQCRWINPNPHSQRCVDTNSCGDHVQLKELYAFAGTLPLCAEFVNRDVFYSCVDKLYGVNQDVR
jgi:hypothetical protein